MGCIEVMELESQIINNEFKRLEAIRKDMDKMDYNNLTDKDCRIIEVCSWEGKIVKHFKGDLYIILNIAEHTETHEKMVVYKALYGDCKIYVRPMDMFIERCDEQQFNMYGQVFRFVKVEVESVQKVIKKTNKNYMSGLLEKYSKN